MTTTGRWRLKREFFGVEPTAMLSRVIGAPETNWFCRQEVPLFDEVETKDLNHFSSRDIGV